MFTVKTSRETTTFTWMLLPVQLTNLKGSVGNSSPQTASNKGTGATKADKVHYRNGRTSDLNGNCVEDFSAIRFVDNPVCCCVGVSV
jgi:hypothetical protein